MQMALKHAGIETDMVNYINAHGTSTLADTIELAAIERLFKGSLSRIKMSSSKSSMGHLLGAAGAVEAIICVLALRDQILPPTINLENPAFETEIDLIPKESIVNETQYVLSNSFGFGGTNACLIMGKAD